MSHPDGRRETKAEAKRRKRAEAEKRNAKANVSVYPCGHKHGEKSPGRCK